MVAKGCYRVSPSYLLFFLPRMVKVRTNDELDEIGIAEGCMIWLDVHLPSFTLKQDVKQNIGVRVLHLHTASSIEVASFNLP